jgi:hypothetical protein
MRLSTQVREKLFSTYRIIIVTDTSPGVGGETYSTGIDISAIGYKNKKLTKTR